jgi:Fe-S-cluster containining protein
VIPDRLLGLANDLASDEGYVSGRRRYPGTVTPDDAADIAEGLQAQMDEAAAARAELAATKGMPLACGAGCTGCCEEPVVVFLPEAHAIARWLRREESSATRAAFLEAHAAWRERAGEGPARIVDAFAAGDGATLNALHVEHWRKRILCPFNRDGLCTIYPVRPLLCRNAHAVGTSAHCFGDDTSGVAATRIRARAVDDFVERARAGIRAAHHALGGPRMRPQPLADAVAALLDQAP